MRPLTSILIIAISAILIFGLFYTLSIKSDNEILTPIVNNKVNGVDSYATIEKTITADTDPFLKDKFNQYYGIVKISKDVVWNSSSQIAEYSLISNTEQCLIDCYATGKAILYKDGPLFDSTTFKDKLGNSVNIKSFKYYIRDIQTETYQVALYDDKCQTNFDKGNITPCPPIGYKNETITNQIWKEYNGEVLKAGNYEWMVKGTKRPEQTIDFIPVKSNIELPWAWWSSSWLKKKAVYLNVTYSNINQTSSLLNVSYDTDMLTNFSDLRFIDSSETSELGYWFYNNTYISSNAVQVWVYTGDLNATSNKTIYMYYNNSGATTTSNISNAFMFGDDFDTGINTNVWQSNNLSKYSVSNGILNSTTDATVGNALITKVAYNNYIMEMRTYANNVNFDGVYLPMVATALTWSSTDYIGIITNQFRANINSGDNRGGSPAANTYYRFMYYLNGTGDVTANFTSDSGTELYHKTATPAKRGGYVGYDTTANMVYSDWIYIRRVVPVETTVSFGAEESSGGGGPTESLTVNLTLPLNNSQYNITTIPFNFSFTPVSVNLTNYTSYIWYGNGSLYNQTYATLGGSANTSIQVNRYFNSVTQNYSWNVYGCGVGATTNNLQCAWSYLGNRTFNVNMLPLQFTLDSPDDGVTLVNSTVFFNCSATSSNANISNMTLVLNGAIQIILNNTLTNSSRIQNYSTAINGLNSWYCTADDGTIGSPFSSTTRTFTIDSTNGTRNTMVSYWNFEENNGSTTSDVVLYRNNGTLVGMPNWTTSGKLGNGLLFNGINNSIIVNGTPSLNLTSNFSYHAWIYPYDTQSEMAIVDKSATSDFSFGLSLTANKALKIKYFSSAWYSITTSPNIIPTNKWSYVAASRNDTAVSLYFNGVLINQLLNVNPISPSIGNLTIGYSSYNNSNWFNGSIDEVGVFNRSFTSSDVMSYYNGQHGLSYLNTSSFKISNITRGIKSDVFMGDSNVPYNITYTLPMDYTTSGYLWFNNTRYDITQTSLGNGNYRLQSTQTIPFGAPTDFISYWEIRFENGTEFYNYNVTNKQNVNDFYFSYCNSTNNVPYVNFTFVNETVPLERVNAKIISTFTYWTDTVAYNKTFSFSNITAENPSYSFCGSPSYKTFHISPDIDYYNSESLSRTYNTIDLTVTNSTTNISLSLLPSSLGQNVAFQIINPAQQSVVGALVTVSSGTETIGAKLTDGSGVTSFFLNPNTAYTITVSKTGYTTISTSITPTQTSYTLQFNVASTPSTDYTKGISTIVMPINGELVNNTVYLFNFTLGSTYWTVTSFGFSLTNGSTLIGTANALTNGGITSLSASTQNYTNIIMNYYWVINGTSNNATRIWAVNNDEGVSWSLKTTLTDLGRYIKSGMFGLDNFSVALIAFFAIFIFAGVLSYKFGLTSGASISFLIFALVLLLDVGIGSFGVTIIPNPISAISHFPTFFAALIFIGLFLREVM